MARVAKGFLLGTHYDLTFYLMDGNLYVRMKSSLSRKKVKYSPRFVRTMQSAGELGRASRLASRIYWELNKEQRKIVFVLYKKMTGVAKLAFKYGKSEAEAERDVREYLVTEGVVKPAMAKEKRAVAGKTKVNIKKGNDFKRIVIHKKLPTLFVLAYQRQDGISMKRKGKSNKLLTSDHGPPNIQGMCVRHCCYSLSFEN